MNINDEGRSNAAYWHKRATEAEARLALVENDLRNATACWHAACHDIAVRDERLAEAETALRIIAEQDWRYDELKARLAEAEHLILRMAGEDYQRARFYVEKYDLTGERAAVSASAVQPERCCLDYPRCDCNSPPEPAQEPKGCNHFPGQVNCEWCTEVPHE